MEGAGRAIERKVITALFCDVVGSTELGERLDPEDVDRLMASYHRLARRRVEANGGAVEKFLGDAVVGVFGAPTVHEDDPARAVRAALNIISDLDASGLGLQVRIGIHTGEAVVRVGDERSPEEGFATGDILNTAARLQNVASPGGIAAGDPTYRLTTAEFEWEDLGDVPLKGKALPVRVWRPLRPTTEARPGGAEATPFLGRDPELETLLAAFARATSRPGVELVTIVGEPGMGKSRLVREFGRRVLAGGDVTWRKGRSLPYGDGATLWALGEIVKSHAGILESDKEAAIAAKLEAAITESDPALRAWQRERLAPLVGLRTDAAPPAPEEAFTAWSTFLVSFAAHGPAVLVFEDLHWADPAIVSFLTHLADVGAAVPLVIVATARPEVSERHPGWLERAARSTMIQLVSLDDQAVRALVAETFAGAPEALIVTVLERAAGSPLYAEQLAALARDRSVSSAAMLLDESAIPPTIQALLTARIDALPRELKPALLDASVIGRVFWPGAVATLEGGDRASVSAILGALAERELTRELVPSTMAGEAEYGFWHALLRDVAYSFLPRPARLAKHRAAARWISARSGEGLDGVAEIVADHLHRALELATATGADDELPTIKSDLASALIAAAAHTIGIEPARAVEQLRSALDVLGDDARRATALSELARALLARGLYQEAAATFEAAATAYRVNGDDLAAANLAFGHVAALKNSGDEPRARAVIQTARPIHEANPGPGLIGIYEDEAIQAGRGDDFDGVIAAADRALELAKQLGLPRPYRALEQRGLHAIQRHDATGEADVREAVELALAAGDTRFAVGALANRATILDRADAALEAFDEGLAMAARYGVADGHVRALRLDSLELAGRWDDVIEDSPALLADAIERGDAFTAVMIRMVRGAIELERGMPLTSMENLMEETAAIGFRPYVGAPVETMRALARGDRDGVRRTILETIALVPDAEHITGAVTHVRAALEIGDVALARRVLEKAMPEPMSGGRSHLTQLATALVLEAEDDLAAALPRFEACIAYFGEHGWAESHGQALAGAGRCRVGLDEVQAGIELLERARQIAVFLKTPKVIASIDTSILAARSLLDGSGSQPASEAELPQRTRL
jgi:class 3 adenylate cyclase/tetratricopeptide (TPR) repeat protein